MVDQLFSTAALLVKLPTSLSLNQGVKHFLPARWYWVYSIHCYAGKKKSNQNYSPEKPSVALFLLISSLEIYARAWIVSIGVYQPETRVLSQNTKKSIFVFVNASISRPHSTFP